MSKSGKRGFWARLLAWLYALWQGDSQKPETPTPELPTPEPQTRKRWTFMVYMAGDNNLEGAGQDDLEEIKQVGSTDQVNIVAQFDGRRDQAAYRYYLREGKSLRADLVQQLPEINTGDEQHLEDFIRWAVERYPADRYALILWNHGTGWKDDDLYAGLSDRGLDAKALTRGQMRGLTNGSSSRALFRSSVSALAEEALVTGRAILFDDTSADFLDNVEMKAVLDRVTASLGIKIDLLGCDACLMNMLEVAYQVHTACHCLVGSQENEPGDGWPYDTILARLVANPEMDPAMLGAVIVEEYNTFYRRHYPNLPVTQSALYLDRIEPLAELVSDLGDLLRAQIEADWQAGNTLVSLALYDVQRFTDRDYVDLYHFCQLLVAQNPGSVISEAAGRILTFLQQEGDSPLIAEGHGGPGMRHAHGISIYIPERSLSPLYQRLEFVKNHRWDEFLTAQLMPHYRTR